MKKRLVLLACMFLALHLGACTSKDSAGDEAAAEESLSADGSLEDVEGFESAEGDAGEAGDASMEGVEGEGALADAGGEGFTEEAAPEAGGDESMAAVDEGGSVEGGDMSADMPPIDDSSLPPAEPSFTDSAPPADQAFTDSSAPDMMASEPPPTDIAPPVDTAPPAADPAPVSSSSGSSFPVLAVKKMEATPIEREGAILNAVYYARPGDSFSKISKMIYGSGSRAKDLRAWNPDTMPRIGDPVYYNSPNRPGDANVMKVYYDDIGQQPTSHIAGEGEDLKKLSKESLGFSGAWKEVWATNSVDSKGKLSVGTEIKFWGATGEVAPAAPAPVLAETTPAVPAPELPAEPDLGMPAPPVDDMAQMPPAPDMGMPPAPEMGMPPADQAMLPPPPEGMPGEPDMGFPPPDAGTGDAMAGTAGGMPEMAPPPPPPPPPAPETPSVAKKADQLGGDSADNDIMMALIAGGGIAALLAGFMVARRRRQQREMAAAFGDTQVGT